jgi:hypothetical protein
VIIRQVCFRSPGLRSCLDCCSRGTCHSPAIRTTARSSSATRVVTIPPVATFLVGTTSGLRTHVLYFLAGLLASRRSSGLPLPALSVVVLPPPTFTLPRRRNFSFCSVPDLFQSRVFVLFCVPYVFRSWGLSVVCCDMSVVCCTVCCPSAVSLSCDSGAIYILAGSLAVASI